MISFLKAKQSKRSIRVF